MGLALEWLGVEGCRSLAVEVIEGARVKREEVWGHCPWHNEQTPGNAFSYNFAKDAALCLSCGGAGDLISVWCARYGLGGKEGFLEFKKKYGNDSYHLQDRPSGSRQPRPANHYEKTRDMTPAPARWKERAASFVDHSFERLLNNEKALAELEQRWGITEKTVLEWGIGINDRDKWPPESAWGLLLAEDRGQKAEGQEHRVEGREHGGKKKKIWLPRGLVIPGFDENGLVCKLKIRRPDPRTPWGEMRTYWEVKGGENWRFHCYYKQGTRPRVIVVTEAERDAALVYQTIGDGSLGAIAGGGAAKRPYDSQAVGLIKHAEVLLVALDTDGPGAKNAVDFWLNEFGFAIHWPVPKKYGKDVGEAWQKGMDISLWLMAYSS